MPSSERPPAGLSAEDQDRQADLERFRSGILRFLGERNLLHSSPAEQSAALGLYLRAADRDSAFFTEDRDVADLILELHGYGGADFPAYAARRIQARLEKEGKYSDKKAFQEKIFVRKQALRGWRTFPGNFAFSYGIEPEERLAHIHLSNPYIEKGQDETAGAPGAAALFMFLKGLKQFADEVVGQDPAIEKITASSVILGRPEFAGILKMLGFGNLGEIPGELKRRHFMGETRPVIGMEAPRAAFLEALRRTDSRTLRAEAIKLLRAAKSEKP